MQVSSKDQGITKQEVLKRLQGRLTSRQMTEFCSKGWLPTWRERRTLPGSKAPVYIWDESVVEQAALLCELLKWSHVDQRVRLPLWLLDYEVEFAPLREGWLDSIDAYLQVYTQGESDNPLDNITDVISELEYKWEHTPTPYRPEDMRRLGPTALAQGMELFLDVLLVPDCELDETTFAEVLTMASAAGSRAEVQGKVTEGFSSWLPKFQEILALPRLREAIEQATPEVWEQARSDYITLCEFAQTILLPIAQIHPVPHEMSVLLFAAAGSYLVPVALALRYWKHGDWIDEAFAWIRDNLGDLDGQEVQDLLAHIRSDENVGD